MRSREKLIAEYHEMMATDDGLTPEFFADLTDQMRKRGLVYGGRPIGVALRPHFLTRNQYCALSCGSEILAGAFNRIASALLSHPVRLEAIGLTERETRLSLVDPKYPLHAVTTRLDAFISDDEIKFVEYNAENPSSITDQASLNEFLHEVPAMRACASRYRLRQFATAERLLSSILETFREWGGVGTPHVGIVDWAGLPTAEEFILLREYFASREVPTIVCTPEELEYEKGRLRRGEFPIDVVYKRVIIHELLERYDDTHPLLKAYVEGKVCVINNFRCKMLHKKATFELLTDDSYGSWFTPTQRTVMRQTVPWTRRVAERKTTYMGSEIDLVEYVRKNRHAFVLKPNDDYGGHGVLLGELSDESEWDAALAQAFEGDYVVQEKVNLPTEVFPIFDDKGWALQPMYVDTNPFLFNGKVEGAMVRLSDSPVVNVTSGGGETGLFVIEEAL